MLLVPSGQMIGACSAYLQRGKPLIPPKLPQSHLLPQVNTQPASWLWEYKMSKRLGKIKMYQKIARYLASVNAVVGLNRRKTRTIALAIGNPVSTTLVALKEMLEAAIVGKWPKTSGPCRFLTRTVGNKHTRPDFVNDLAYIQSLAGEDSRVARIVQGVNLAALDMLTEPHRRTFNAIVEAIQKLGLGQQLGTYQLVSHSYHWWLVPHWRMKLEEFIHPQQGHLQGY